ncbi:Phage major capsid protein, HK97 family [uncultured Mycobacterium sp.]|uniref:Phage major capsid protein, HK97 family n=1 Tax=uncultured Mycobacterium sp. TaxID=171292 RepID=A0A1Y5PHS2_9MYCO|nr:Phage major capsid protein, HK97 family [uncultured Mycobacterium sp.]
MATNTTTAASILRPEQVGPLIVQPLTAASVAMQASTVAQTDSTEFRIPIITGDPDASWVPEGTEIPVDDADFDEEVVVPKKVAALSVLSNELIEDSSPEASAVIGARLVQSLVRKVDAAWFANTTTNGPSGLGSITPTLTYAGAAYANVDAFLEAVTAAESAGAQVNTFVTHPATALALAKLKKATGSNEPLLQRDVTVPGGRIVAGVPLLVSPHAPNDGSVYGIPKDRTFVVIRRDVQVVLDSSAFFTSDRTAVRVTARIGFGFPHPAAVVKVNKTVAP